MLRAPVVALGLTGALCGYLVLFGPLTLLPQVLGAGVGLVLTCLPAGFAVAAVAADRVLPSKLGTRGRVLLGAAASVAGCSALVFTVHSGALAGVSLFVLGLGLGVFIPANNSAIMGAIPARSSAAGEGW